MCGNSFRSHAGHIFVFMSYMQVIKGSDLLVLTTSSPFSETPCNTHW